METERDPIAGATQQQYTDKNNEGNFKVEVSSIYGCNDLSAVTEIDRLNQPKATITPQGDLDICATGSVELKSSGGASATFQWKKDGSKINGATNQLYTATEVGDYQVKVTNASGCSKDFKENGGDFFLPKRVFKSCSIRIGCLSQSIKY
jgi:hypothetical protein